MNRCPECQTPMRVEYEFDFNQHVVTDRYWLCPACGHCESAWDVEDLAKGATSDDSL